MFSTCSRNDLHEKILDVDHIVGLVAGGHNAGETSLHTEVVVVSMYEQYVYMSSMYVLYKQCC